MKILRLWPYFVLGAAFGFVLTKAEVISWFRMQEMFRFHSFHMYGVMGSAVLTGASSLALIKRLGLKDADGQPLGFPPKVLGRGIRYVVGGTLFGIGWAIGGACPGPARGTGRRGRPRDAGDDRERARRHVGVRLAATPSAPLTCAGRCDSLRFRCSRTPPVRGKDLRSISDPCAVHRHTILLFPP